MRTILAILVLSIAGTAFIISPESPEAVKGGDEGIQFFKGTWAEALEKSKAENKPIFVDVYTTWCGPCKWMSKYTFTDDEVAKFYNEKFICVKADAERGEGITLARKYKVRAYPTLLFVKNDGSTILKTEGARSSEQFIQLGNKVLGKVN